MRGTHKFAALFLAGILVVWVVLMGIAIKASVLPDTSNGILLVVFKPGTTNSQAFAVIVRAGGNPVRPTWLSFIWTAQSNEAGFVGRLKQYGATTALKEFPFSPQLAGCFAFNQRVRAPTSLKSLSP